MKKTLLFAAIIFSALTSQAQTVNIPDVAFKNYLINNGFDTSGDGEISGSEAAVVTNLSLEAVGVSDLTGIESFFGLEVLNLNYNNQLTEVDLSANFNLNSLSTLQLNSIQCIDVHPNVVNTISLTGESDHFVSTDCSNVSTASLENIKKQTFKVYPNPTENGILFLNTIENIKTIDLINILGEKIETVQPNQTKLNFSMHPKGVYFLNISTQNTTHTHKIILK